MIKLEKVGSMFTRVENFINEVSQDAVGNEWLYDIRSSNRVWTRGDGSRYKELSKIVSRDQIDHIDNLWDKIKSNGKDIGKMSDEFASMPSGSAVLWDRIIFVKRNNLIEFGSQGRLKNSSVCNIRIN